MTTQFGTLIQITITAAILTIAANSEKAEAGDKNGIQVDIQSRFLHVEDNFLRDIGVDIRGLGQPNGYGYGQNFELDALNVAEQGSFEAGRNIRRAQKFDRQNQNQNNYGQTNSNNGYDGANSNAHEGLLRALANQDRGQVISTPKVITQNNEAATIQQGTEIPYQDAYSSGDTSVQFKEAVLDLNITPRVTPDDRIIMDLQVNNHDTQYNAPAYNQVPSIDTRQVQTNVLVNNGQTVVLGGIYDNNLIQHQDKVPYLADIPALGHLFRNKHTQSNKEELLIFVTPQITKIAE